MSRFIAALPMYDWPETRGRTDAQWAAFRDAFRRAGIDAPEHLTRQNTDLTARTGGRSAFNESGNPTDPSETGPEGLDLQAVWRHPGLLFGQTCWGPMGEGLSDAVQVIGQPDYSDVEGGDGPLYSSAILMRRGAGPARKAPETGGTTVPLDLFAGKRLAFNGTDSMSGLIGLSCDLEAMGAGGNPFAERLETGSHRVSAIAVAEGLADVCAVDCRTWALIEEHEPAADGLVAVGWTARRKGLPYICSRMIDAATVATMRGIVSAIEGT